MSYIVPQKMPLRCFECGHISSSTMDGYSCKIAHKSLASEHGINVRRPDWCPLVEIPTPHGRLIDADEIEMPCLETTADQKWMEIAIKSTPAIIEAEGSET